MRRLLKDYRGLILYSVLVIALGFGALEYLKENRTKKLAMQQAQVVEDFRSALLPLYLKKAELLRSFIIAQKIPAPEVESILLHIGNWNPHSYSDIHQIQEVAGYLDQHFSQYFLSQTKGQDLRSHPFYRKLESLEREIRTQESNILDLSPQ